jgi:uncharacterized Zn finger protein
MRQRDHLADAIAVYQAQVERVLAQTNSTAYEQAVKLLHQVGTIMGRLDQEAEFATYLAGVRAGHKRKRNFMKLLAASRW